MNVFSVMLCVFVAADGGRFSVVVPAQKVYLMSASQTENDGRRKKVVLHPSSLRWEKFVQVLDMGLIPQDGVCNVDGKPIAPTVVVVSRRAGMATVRKSGSGWSLFDVLFESPGKFMLRVSVGRSWSKDIQIEVVQLPIWRGMKSHELLERLGFPDKRKVTDGSSAEYLEYGKFPGCLIEVRSGAVRDVIHTGRMNPRLTERLRDTNPFARD